MRTNSSVRRRGKTSLIAGMAVFAVLAASCSDDDKTSDTTTAGSTATTSATSDSSAGTTTPATDPLGEENKASGDPIVVGVINEGGGDTVNQQSENTLKGIEIAAQYANDYLGGIDGHPIQIESCGNKNTPAGATDCANQMVEKGVDVYVQPYSGFESTIVPILTAAKIPMFVMSGSSSEGLTTPGVYAVTGGFPGTLGAFAVHAKGQGITKFAMIVIDVPAATGAASALGGMAFAKEGVEFSTIAVPLGTADMAPMLQSAIADGADAIGVTGDAAFCTGFLQAYKTLALDVPKYVISTCNDPAVRDAAGDVLDGSFTVAGRDATSPDAAAFVAAVAKYGDGDGDVRSAVADGWVSLMSLVNVLSGYTGDIDPAAIEAAIKAATDTTIPLSGGLTFTCDGTAISILANICSAQFQMGVLDAEGNISGLESVDAAEAFAP